MQKALFIYKDNNAGLVHAEAPNDPRDSNHPVFVSVSACTGHVCISWLLTRHWEFENPVRVKRGETRRFSPYFNSQTCPFPWVKKEKEKSMRHTVLTVASSRSINARWLLLRGWFVLACCRGIQFGKKKQATNQTKQANRNCCSRFSLEVQI